MHKKVLSEQFVITHKVADILKFHREKIVSNCVKNYFFNKRVEKEEWYEQFNYCVTDDHQHLSWMHDYIRDHYKVEYNETPIIVRRHGIVLENNASFLYEIASVSNNTSKYVDQFQNHKNCRKKYFLGRSKFEFKIQTEKNKKKR